MNLNDATGSLPEYSHNNVVDIIVYNFDLEQIF